MSVARDVRSDIKGCAMYLGDAKARICAFFRGDPNLKKLKSRGLTVGKNFKLLGGCIIDHSHCWLISIGDNVTFAPRVHVLAHDASPKRDIGYTRIGLTKIGDNTFVGAGSIILPGVTIGNDVVIGAGSVVTSDVPDGMVFAGNPARAICTKEKYLKRCSEELQTLPVFSDGYTLRGGITPPMRMEMLSRLEDAGGRGYVC